MMIEQQLFGTCLHLLRLGHIIGGYRGRFDVLIGLEAGESSRISAPLVVNGGRTEIPFSCTSLSQRSPIGANARTPV